MTKNNILLTAFTLLLLSSCTEDISIDIIGGQNTIVIEGSIENGKPATVIVTRNSPVSEPLDFNKILVTDAKVYVSNGSVTDTLSLTIDSSASIPLAYKGNKIIGAVGGIYYLTVIADGKTYTSSTTIPALVKLDSVWWQPQPPEDSLGYAWARLSDPAGYGNAYRWFAKLAGRDRRYVAPLGASFDDKFTNAETFDFYAFRGVDPTSTASEDTTQSFNKYYYKKTDTIFIKFCTIDYNAFRFYYSYETALQSNGNPFASPVGIRTNISGGGLGVWAGFGATYDTIYGKP